MVLLPVLVIGGSGFLGTHVCRVLAEKGHAVLCYDVRSPELSLLQPTSGSGSVRFIKGDILDPEALADCVRELKVAGVIHTAAAGNEAAARKEPHPAITLNVQGTLNVLEAARKAQVSRFVYISTAGVYGLRKDQSPIKEDEAIRWRGTIYHPSHYMGEILVEMYREVYGMSCVSLRPLSIYGPACSSDRVGHMRGKSLFLGAWIGKAMKGDPVEIKAADTLTDLTYIKDIADAVSLAYSKRDQKHAVYNISSGQLVSYRQIAAAIQRSIPQAEFEFFPGAQDNPLRPTRGPLDITRAGQGLGFAPQYDLARGLKEFVEWCKETTQNQI